MSLSINNNITSLNAWRNLKQTDSKMSSAMEKLSSGLRINKAADDPAGLVISEKMRAQLAGLTAAMNNSEKAINMVQTAEAALDKTQSLLDKIRQLAIDTANSGVNDKAMNQANQEELDEAISSITRIANYTQFGTKKLLDGTVGTNFSINAGSTSKVAAVNINSTNTAYSGAAALNVTTAAAKATLTITASGAGGDVTFAAAGNVNAGALAAMTGGVSFKINGQDFAFAGTETLDSVAKTINGFTDATGVTAAATATTITLTSTDYGANQAITFTSNDADVAAATQDKTKYGTNAAATLTLANGDTKTLTGGEGLRLSDTTGNFSATLTATGNAVANLGDVGTLSVNQANFQIGANESQTVTVSIASVKATDLGAAATYTKADGTTGNVTFLSLEALSTTGSSGGVFVKGSADQIAQAIGLIDKSIEQVSSMRGKLGAIQSDNLQVQLDSLRVSYENLQAAESTIRDTDMTSQMAQFTKYQIMMQAGTAMLAQANQMPNNILTLLR